MDPLSTYQLIQTGGVVVLLLLIIIGGAKKWWVFGWQYRACEQSSVRWMELALRSTNLAESLGDVQKQQPTKLP